MFMCPEQNCFSLAAGRGSCAALCPRGTAGHVQLAPRLPLAPDSLSLGTNLQNQILVLDYVRNLNQQGP